ncbi:adenosine deaminase [Xenorhabdus cabanillasii]|uniref:adenosine deaminase n=1 Tax=Xenorhabdus cabanillasii JM26 TaxID=1427517 RepID=W1J816_9GAMM|nr:adenosine deaminase [Xenorhabdus cabanillasii]PHM76486.1 adenosine deaminase [Xenorhabdus cabanillasii JM26]CDL86864.1 Adenosine deaminase 2 [Xenorhabdus cabanillasii JM26]
MTFDPRFLEKVELHVHLDTCLSYHYVKMLCPNLTLKKYQDEFITFHQCQDLGEFLSKITPQLSLLQTIQAISFAVDDLFDQLHADNVIYAEIRFAPLLHQNHGLSPEIVTETVLIAMHQATHKYGIEARLILCTLRHFTASESMQTARLAAKYLNQGVVALDLSADEARYPLDNHIAAFEYMYSMGGNCIAHAGEAKGHESVTETLEKLKVTRIGHGVRCIENNHTIDQLKANNIHLEICPTCNIICNVFKRIEEHPVNKLKKSGVNLSINTDARTIVNTTLNKEYILLHNTFGWGHKDFIDCNLSAITASFISLDMKKRLSDIIRNSFIKKSVD